MDKLAVCSSPVFFSNGIHGLLVWLAFEKQGGPVVILFMLCSFILKNLINTISSLLTSTTL